MAVPTNIKWYANRLRAMNLREVGWRVSQRRLQRSEKSQFGRPRPVTARLFFEKDARVYKFNASALGVRFDDMPEEYVQDATPTLLGGFSYEDFKNDWHAGFQTENRWPLEFAHELSVKQRQDIGDVRLNWELNRHYQFVFLAADYTITGIPSYLESLNTMFRNWNESNPFLWGVAWTSPMEVALRSISWMLTLGFLKQRNSDNITLSRLRVALSTGIVNMTEFIVRHRSRHTSANNHLIVEIAAVGLAGYAFGRDDWKQLALDILDEELARQNSPDGVNREMSLHYHAFVMEAYMLFANAMRCNGDEVPEQWTEMIGKMADFLSHSMIDESSAMEFGDSDEGKIIDLQGDGFNHYRYLLQAASLLTGRRFDSFEHTELTTAWLHTPEEIEKIKEIPMETPALTRTFADGGYTFMRSDDGSVLIGVDHAPLGFGSIAAHGHADAMSLQLYDNGTPVLIDSGTYLYHCSDEKRNAIRSELAHNTVCYHGHPQSEMLGAFLWGKKGSVAATVTTDTTGNSRIEISGKTFDGTPMGRKISYDPKRNRIELLDLIHSPQDTVSFITTLNVELKENRIALGPDWTMILDGQTAELEPTEISRHYGIAEPATAIRLHKRDAGESRVTIQKKRT